MVAQRFENEKIDMRIRGESAGGRGGDIREGNGKGGFNERDEKCKNPN